MEPSQLNAVACFGAVLAPLVSAFAALLAKRTGAISSRGIATFGVVGTLLALAVAASSESHAFDRTGTPLVFRSDAPAVVMALTFALLALAAVLYEPGPAAASAPGGNPVDGEGKIPALPANSSIVRTVAILFSLSGAVVAALACDALVWLAGHELAGLALSVVVCTPRRRTGPHPECFPGTQRTVANRAGQPMTLHIAGAGLVLAAILLARTDIAEPLSFAIPYPPRRAPALAPVRLDLLGAFLLAASGLALRSAVFPFHRAVDSFRAGGPAVLLALGILHGTGLWGLFRVFLPLLGTGARAGAPWVAGIALGGAVFIALLAWAAPDRERSLLRGVSAHLTLAFAAVASFEPALAAAGLLHAATSGLAAAVRIGFLGRPAAGNSLPQGIGRLVWIGFPGTGIFASGVALLAAFAAQHPGRALAAGAALALAGTSVFRRHDAPSGVSTGSVVAASVALVSSLALGLAGPWILEVLTQAAALTQGAAEAASRGGLGT